jgi:hypothetical protein|tara:strand:- start:870 stop:1082 length:213 start_codon:yes stop_codon:yes gene_type:complete
MTEVIVQEVVFKTNANQAERLYDLVTQEIDRKWEEHEGVFVDVDPDYHDELNHLQQVLDELMCTIEEMNR